MASQKIKIELKFERRNDGRYFVTSDDIPGFRMAGTDIEAIQNDLEDVVRDLLRFNAHFEVEEFAWVPTLEEAKRHLQKPDPQGRAIYIATGNVAA